MSISIRILNEMKIFNILMNIKLKLFMRVDLEAKRD